MMRHAADESSVLRRHMHELDVLRGVAILSVVIYHGFYWMNGTDFHNRWVDRFMSATVIGWLGVNLFFILSGFLITGILLDTKDSNNYFRSFYIKRALRILPVYLLTLTVVVLLRQTSVGGLVVSLLFLVNCATALGVGKIYRPPWSLAVEEHFYLLWPLIIYKLKTRLWSSLQRCCV